MTEKMPHSAAGQMLGYLYQCEWALVELARQWFKEPEAELRMEMLDDIDILHGDVPVELVQSKHHGGQGELGPTSADLWRSINSWCDALELIGDGPLPLLRLVTTQSVSSGSLLEKLRADSSVRDVPSALRALETLAGDSAGPKSTRAWRERFLRCTPVTREALVGQVVVDDLAPRVSEVDSKLREVIGVWKTHESQAQDILAELKGWWWGVSKEMLDRLGSSRPSVSAEELRTKIDYVLSKYAQTYLPFDDRLERLTEDELSQYQDRVFVTQLRILELGRRSVRFHLGEYHHAWAHRARWLRHHYVDQDELKQFESDLRREWERVFSKYADAVEAGSYPGDVVEAGNEILDKAMAAAEGIRLRPGVDKRWVSRGTLHALADLALKDPDPVGWHPSFEDLLQNFITTADAED
ncbi:MULTISPECIES: ABC-three component system protein [unclassified Streptomyces]|uniref:ABC-three component system protein n=1 Tax=unclassified Streptomyces TaxID=2593676 RepID=UPI002E2ABC39|nr:ABC-three component system protein [Streptomyces sp. NBC_00343]